MFEDGLIKVSKNEASFDEVMKYIDSLGME